MLEIDTQGVVSALCINEKEESRSDSDYALRFRTHAIFIESPSGLMKTYTSLYQLLYFPYNKKNFNNIIRRQKSQGEMGNKLSRLNERKNLLILGESRNLYQQKAQKTQSSSSVILMNHKQARFFSRIMSLILVLMLSVPQLPLLSQEAKAIGGGEDYPYSGTGDWLIDNDTFVYNETIEVNGNLIIQDGGKLVLRGTTIKMNVSSNGQYYIQVETGGELQVLDWDNDSSTQGDRSIITDGDWDNDSAAYNSAENHRFSMRVRSGSTFIMTNSELRESGYGGGDKAGTNLDGRSEFVFEGNFVTKCYRGLQLVYSYGPGKQVRNNTFDACESAGIIMYYSHNTTLEDNAFYNCPHEGIYLYSHPNNPLYYTSDNTIRNNYFQDNIYGTYLYGANCYRNEFYNNEHVHDRYGITTTTDPHNNTFRDIKLKESWSYGIYTTTRSVNNTFRDLEITDSNYAILTTGRSYNNLYEDILIKDTNNYAIYPTGKSHDNYYVNMELDNQKYGIVPVDDVWNTWLVNTTIKNTRNTDVLLDEGSNLTLVNTSFSSLFTSGGSYLTEMNYLDIHVENMRGTPVEGADVSVLAREIGVEEGLPENLADPRLGAQASATSEYNWRWLAERAVDGKIEDGSTQEHYWLTKNNPPADTYFQLDLAAEKEFDLVRFINVRNAGYQDRATKDFRLMMSSNNTWYEEIHNGTMTEHDISNWYEVQLTEPVTARYLRFYVDSIYGKSGGLAEFEVYNTSRTTKSFDFQTYATELFGGVDRKTDAQGNIDDLPVITRRWYNHYGPQVYFENDVKIGYKGWESEAEGLRFTTSRSQDFVKDVLTVGASGKDLTTIQGALDYAATGPEEKIKVFPGEYSETLVVPDHVFDIYTATGLHNDTVLKTGGGTAITASGSKELVVDGLVVSGANVAVDSAGSGKSYRNLSFQSTTTPFRLRDGAELDTINTAFDDADLVFDSASGSLYEKNIITVETQGRLGEPVFGVDVELKDKDKILAASLYTDENGLAQPHALLHRVLEQGKESLSSPYGVSIEKGDGSFSDKVVMDQPRHVVLTWYDPLGFGEAVAVGDLDGDGFDDFAVGAPGYDGVGPNSGAVFIYQGGDRLVIEDLTADNYDYLVAGEREGDRFGTALAMDGDLNGDGFDDLVVGSPYTNHTQPQGIRTRYYHSQGEDKFADFVLEQVEDTIDHNWGNAKPHSDVNADNFGIMWDGFINIEREGEYSFHIFADDGVHFYFDGDLLIDQWSYSANEYSSGSLYLEEGLYPFLVELHEGGGAAKMELRWDSDFFDKEIIPAEAFWYADNTGPGKGGVYRFNGREDIFRLWVQEEQENPRPPFLQTIEMDFLLSGLCEDDFGARELGRELAYLGDLNNDGFDDLGVEAEVAGDQDRARLRVLHGSPLTTQYRFQEQIPSLPDDGDGKDLASLFDPVEWAGPFTGSGGKLGNTPEGSLFFDATARNAAYAYFVSARGSPTGIDFSLDFKLRAGAEEYPVLRVMNHSLEEGELDDGAAQDAASLLVLYDNGSVKLRKSPGADPLQLSATGLGTEASFRMLVSPDHSQLKLYFDGALFTTLDAQDWEEELYLVLGDSSIDRYNKAITLDNVLPGHYSDALGFNASLLPEGNPAFAGASFTGDGAGQLVLAQEESYVFRSQDRGLFTSLDNMSLLFEGGAHSSSHYRDGSLIVMATIPGVIANGDFANGWDNWTFMKNSQNQLKGIERMLTEAVGDWLLSPLSGSPTACYGSEGDTLDAQGGKSTGRIQSEAFTISNEMSHIQLWRHWKVMSFDKNEGMTLKIHRSSDDAELLNIEEWFPAADSTNYEVEGFHKVDVTALSGETVYLVMETIGGDGGWDDGLFQMDDVVALGSSGSGSFESRHLLLPEDTIVLAPQWAAELNGGQLSLKIRTDNATAWDDAQTLENGEFFQFPEPATSFQFRFDISTSADQPSPELRELEFLVFNDTCIPLRLNHSAGYHPVTGDLNGDGRDELVLASGENQEVLVYSGETVEQALVNGEHYLDPDDYLMAFDPGAAGTEAFGAQVSVVRDVDSDGLRDLCISDPLGDSVVNNGGALYLFYSSESKKDYSLADAAITVDGDVDGGGLGSQLSGVLASQPGGVNPVVEHLPFYLRDVSISSFSLDNNSFIDPESSLKLRMKLANIGFLEAQNIQYFFNISSQKTGYNTSLQGNLSKLDVDQAKNIKMDWNVPWGEDVPYDVEMTLLLDGDNALANNRLTVRLNTRYFRTEVATDRAFDYKRAHEYLVYQFTLDNIGTLGDDLVSLEAEVPEYWEYAFFHQSKELSQLSVSDEEPLELWVRSPTNATASTTRYDITVTATSQNNITSSQLSLEALVVDMDIVAAAIELYREDMKEIGTSRHLIQEERSTVLFSLFNPGNLSTSNFKVKLFYNDSEELVDIASIAPGNYHNISREAYFSAGGTSFRMVVDETNKCFEYDEFNNDLTRNTEVTDIVPDNQFYIYALLLSTDLEPIVNATLLVNIEGNFHQFKAQTNETGHAHIMVEIPDYYEGLPMRVGGLKGSKYAYVQTNIYSDDLEFWTTLMLMKYALEVKVDSLYKEMVLNDEKTAYHTVDYQVTVTNSGNLDEDYRISGERPLGWRYEFLGNITDKGAGNYDLNLRAKSSKVLTLRVSIDDKMDSPTTKKAYGNQQVNISFTVSSLSTPFSIQRTTTTLVRSADNLTIHGIKQGGLYEENGRFYKDLAPGESSEYTISIVNYGNTDKNFYIINEGQNSSYVSVDTTQFRVKCLHNSLYRAEFKVTVTVPDWMELGETLHFEILLMDENISYVEYVSFGVKVLVKEELSLGLSPDEEPYLLGTVTYLQLTLHNPSAISHYLKLKELAFGNAAYHGNFQFPGEGIFLEPGEKRDITIQVEHLNMQNTTIGEELELVVTMIMDNRSWVDKHLYYPVLELHSLALKTLVDQAVLGPGGEHVYILSLENLGNTPQEQVRFKVVDPGAWGQELKPLLLEQGETRTLFFRVRATENAGNGDTNFITIIPVTSGLEMPALVLENHIDLGARLLYFRYFQHIIQESHINYTLELTNDGNFNEELRVEVAAASGSSFFIAPKSMTLQAGETRDIHIEVYHPGDDAGFDNFTVNIYPLQGNVPLTSLELPSYPVSRIESRQTGSEYVFTAVSLGPFVLSYIWELEGAGMALTPEQREQQEITLDLSRAGNYTLTLITRAWYPDFEKLSDETTFTVVVENLAPDLVALPDQITLHKGERLELDGSDLIRDLDGEIMDIIFTFNGTTTHATSFSVLLSEMPGEYILNVVVEDNQGAKVHKDILVTVLEKEVVVSEEEDRDHMFSQEQGFGIWALIAILFLATALLPRSSGKKEQEKGTIPGIVKKNDLKGKQQEKGTLARRKSVKAKTPVRIPKPAVDPREVHEDPELEIGEHFEDHELSHHIEEEEGVIVLEDE